MTRTFSHSVVVAAALTVAGSLLAGCGAQSSVKKVSAAESSAKVLSAPQSADATSKRRFVAYDNTWYKNINLGTYGLIKSNVVYNQPWMREAFKAGKMPNKARFQEYVKRQSVHPGPIVLDFEDHYLQGKPDVAKRNFKVLMTLIKWAREASPGRKFGFYGLNGHTQERYYPLARKLAVYEAAFFPTLYTRHGTDNAAWTKVLKRAIAQARAVDPRKPIYIYMWPRYHKNTPHSLKFIPAKQWTYQLNTAYKLVDGAVIWASSKDTKVPAKDMGWVRATRDFMKTRPHA